MALFAKNSNEIIKDAIKFVNEKTGINATSPGSKFRSLLDIVRKETDESYRRFDFNVASGFVYGANGKFLDYLGELFGIKRYEKTSAYVDSNQKSVGFYVKEGTFGNINNGSDILIPSGTRVWAKRNGLNIEFITTSNLTLNAADSTGYVSIRALESGESSNVQPGAISYHNFNDYADSSLNSLKVTNVSAIDNGRDRESDDNFRYRIINTPTSFAKGNTTALRLAALSVPGVSDVTIIDGPLGGGNTAVLIKSTTPVVSDNLLLRVQNELDIVKSNGVEVTAIKPIYLYAKVRILLNFYPNTTDEQESNARDNVKKAIADYINNLDIGEQLNLSSLALVVKGSHNKIQSVGTPSKLIDEALIKKPVSSWYTTVVIKDNYQPTYLQKIILSTDEDAITIQ